MHVPKHRLQRKRDSMIGVGKTPNLGEHFKGIHSTHSCVAGVRTQIQMCGFMSTYICVFNKC